MVLPFEEQIVSDLISDSINGGLVILSSGLPLHSLISSLLLLHHSSSGCLLLLSASDSQKLHISRTSTKSVTEITPTDNRPSLYTSGSAFFVTPRILIADLLTNRVPPNSIASIIILNAHRLSETSTEMFITRVVKTGVSHNASIYAFSDRPEMMVSGFAKTERIMKGLFVRKLHLWPRFHVAVGVDLEREAPEVVDVRVEMSVAMKEMQKAVLEAMDVCLKELRRTNKVDVEDLTIENGLFKSFDEIVRRQLDPIWHVIGRKTKQLVSDLRTLRKLLDYLVRYDAVTYLKYLDTLRVSEGVRSVWMFTESSHKIFELAKRRVYQMVKADGTKITEVGKNKKKRKANDETSSSAMLDSTVGVVLDEILEEAPKWKMLRELLEEIEEEQRKEALPMQELHMVEGNEVDNDIVLVACKDERSCLQLEDCINKGPQKVMKEEWEKYLLGKAELHNLQKRTKNKNKKRSQDPKGFGILNGVAPVPSDSAEASSISKLENNALLAAASEVIKLHKEEIIVGDVPEQRTPNKEKSVRGRGRGRGRGKAINTTPRAQRSGNEGEKLSKSDKEEKSTLEVEDEHIDKMDIKRDIEEANATESTGAKPIPPVQFYALERDQRILDVWKPSVIIVYHPDMTFVREIEVYKAENPSKKLKVYFLFYEDSTEVRKFESSIRRENSAFESLIRQKSLMMIPVDQDGRCIGTSASCEPQPSQNSLASQNSLTRKAGGRKAPEKQMQIIVDMREFMSSLPNVLHQKGMRVIPVTLEVGDYVLSPLICVERKSIMDLYQSFASGRLYNQVEAMSRYYKIPVLLIEFSQDKSFSFLSASDIGDDVSSTSIISKLSLLVLHFPRLRLVWSRSLHATAEIFASLKSNQDEPDEVKALRVGVPSEDGVVEDDVRAENYNTSAIEFLRRLPGVTDYNYRALMDGCESLAELALLPVERLAELMGGQKAAKTLKEFIDAKCPSML